MKQIVVAIFIFAVSILPIYSQTSDGLTVMGIKGLSPKMDVYESLKERYGVSRIEDRGDEIYIESPVMGDYKFNLSFLYFNHIDGGMKFNGASFQSYYEPCENERAKNDRDYLLEILRKKYEGILYAEYTNEYGFKCCEFGLTPYENARFSSIGTLELTRDVGKDGVARLYLILNYNPFVDTSMDDF